MAKKIWITAAITGGIHTPTMSEYLPQTEDQIIEDAVKAYEAGAASVHIHARNPQTGQPIADLNVMKTIITGIKVRCGAIICITTGGTQLMTLEERLAPIPNLQPELASLNIGSMNFVLSPAADSVRRNGPKYEWELEYLETTYNTCFANSFQDLENYITAMNEAGTRPEFEIYDVNMINNLKYFIDKGVIKTPPYIQFVMGILGGIPSSVNNLNFLVNTAKEMIGEFHWSCAAAGKAQFPMTAVALAMGGNVRVGLEDNLYLLPGLKATSSAEQVAQIRDIAEKMGFEIASANETREILNLKGTDKVNF